MNFARFKGTVLAMTWVSIILKILFGKTYKARGSASRLTWVLEAVTHHVDERVD